MHQGFEFLQLAIIILGCGFKPVQPQSFDPGFRMIASRIFRLAHLMLPRFSVYIAASIDFVKGQGPLVRDAIDVTSRRKGPKQHRRQSFHNARSLCVFKVALPGRVQQSSYCRATHFQETIYRLCKRSFFCILRAAEALKSLMASSLLNFHALSTRNIYLEYVKRHRKIRLLLSQIYNHTQKKKQCCHDH